MFFIMGISQGQKKLKLEQLLICKCCGKYGRAEVFVTYTYLMLFFIPIFKWNKQYFVKMNCCNSIAPIDKETGKDIESGKITNLNLDNLNFGIARDSVKHCSYCDFTTTEDYSFCPKCGRQM